MSLRQQHGAEIDAILARYPQKRSAILALLYIAQDTYGRLTDEAIRVRQALYQQPALAAVQQLFIAEYLAGDTIRRHTVTDAMARRITPPTLVYWGDRNRTPPALGERATPIRCGRLSNGPVGDCHGGRSASSRGWLRTGCCAAGGLLPGSTTASCRSRRC